MDHIHSNRLGDILLEKGIISASQLQLAVREQTQRRLNFNNNFDKVDSTSLGAILIELGFVSSLELKRALSWQMIVRKMTLVFAFVAPVMTTACGGGSGTAVPQAEQRNSPTTLQINSTPPLSSSKPASSKPVSSSSQSVVSSLASSDHSVSRSSTSSYNSSVTSPLNQSSSNNGNGVVPVASSSAAKSSSSVTSSRPKSSSSAPASSSAPTSSSAPSSVPTSSSARSSSLPASSRASTSSSLATSSSASSSGPIAGPITLNWAPPVERENGAVLDITQVGGYEVRYKLKSDIDYTYVTINDAFTTTYYFNWLDGDYQFEIAAFDTNGFYSSFVSMVPN